MIGIVKNDKRYIKGLRRVLSWDRAPNYLTPSEVNKLGCQK